MSSRKTRIAARRAAAKSRLAAPTGPGAAVQARYDAAGQGRRMRGWSAPSSGPNVAMSSGLQTVRNRTRDAARNEWAGASGARIWTTNLIGTGIVPRWRTKNAALKLALRALWREWVKIADADCVLDFYGLQTLIARSWVVSGEVFIRLRARRLEDGLAVPLQIQVLEADMVPHTLNHELADGHRIRAGIELDRIGRRVAFWVHKEHPGDNYARGVSLTELTRVPAAEMRHIFEPLRPGQMRGVSDFAPVLAKLRGVMDFDDAVLERQKLANLFTLFITRQASASPGLDPLTGQPVQVDVTGPIAALEPGTSQELLPGEDVKFSEPPDAGANYADFNRGQHLHISSGMGTPYELLTGDLKDVSDRTLRVVINEFRRHCEQRQWNVLIPMACTPVIDAWAAAVLLTGSISISQLAEARDVDWSPQAWPYLHPVQDVQAAVIAKKEGLTSRTRIIVGRGEDPDDIDQERDEDARRELSLASLQRLVTLTAKPAAPSAYEGSASALARAVTDAVSSMDRTAPQISVPVNVHNSMPPSSITVTNEVQPTPVDVSVHNSVEPTPVTVNNTVEGATVNVPSAQVVVHNDVQPADVRVSLPPRQTDTTIERDGSGNILRTRQIETDAPNVGGQSS